MPSVCGEAMGTAGGEGERSCAIRLLPVELLRLDDAILEFESSEFPQCCIINPSPEPPCPGEKAVEGGSYAGWGAGATIKTVSGC